MKVLRDKIPPKLLASIGSRAALFALVAAACLLFGCNSEPEWHAVDISGSLPPLDFVLTRADDGKTITADDFKGKVVLLYFGYTFCPDICPLTLANVDLVLNALGDKARDVRVLFVTVDPRPRHAPGAQGLHSGLRPRGDTVSAGIPIS